MGLLSAIRERLAGLFGGESAERADESADPTADDEAGDAPEASGDEGLDPTATTEVRADATDDAVDALREVRGSGPPEAGEQAGGSAPTETDGPERAEADDSERVDDGGDREPKR